MSHEMVDQMMEKNKLGELRSPVSETLDMRLVEFGRGEATYEMEAREKLGNPLGVIQGGVATALADAAMAAATTTILSDEEIQKNAITTIENAINSVKASLSSLGTAAGHGFAAVRVVEYESNLRAMKRARPPSKNSTRRTTSSR